MLMAVILFFSQSILAQDSIKMAAASSITMMQDTSSAVTKVPQGFWEELANNKAMLYVIAAIAFVLIIGLTMLSSIRGSKKSGGNNIGYRKPGGGHHHHHHKHHHHH